MHFSTDNIIMMIFTEVAKLMRFQLQKCIAGGMSLIGVSRNKELNLPRGFLNFATTIAALVLFV